MKTVLIPFDFSKASLNALKYAVEFAKQKPIVTVYLLRILPENANEAEVKAKLDEVIADYNKPGFPEIKTLVKQGETAPVIVELRDELNIDLVIIGTRGSKVKREDMTSNTSKFIQQADLPVLVIPENSKYFSLKTIILTMGKEKIADRNVLFTLLDVARRFKAKVHLLTVDKGSKLMGYSEYDEINERTIEYFLEDFYSHHAYLENEDIEEGIKQYLESHNIDMLAIMPKTHLENGKASKGKLTNILTLHSDKPLLVLD
ncbi:Nucleotide-binding universal stress protein, UspA family [Zunongwangia mangrovi]|uniref:Nucleotide-binding universal stress protein, UspA family n=1 Tax=Zunongwangia mangrovi TaxID=1334022 RepID=A0A1I1J0X7_9FLAO|nr:universal stress protein [Zunongwangia mangrovi]SFC39573.1 Nucleotide-binding universal stress protein, UspA family [Zunongwangia mangrovi]